MSSRLFRFLHFFVNLFELNYFYLFFFLQKAQSCDFNLPKIITDMPRNMVNAILNLRGMNSVFVTQIMHTHRIRVRKNK